MWFMKSSKTKKAAVDLLKIKQDDQDKLVAIKQRLNTSFGELESSINETINSASDLSQRLISEEADLKSGTIFFSHTGRVLFANKACFSILAVKPSKEMRILRLYKPDGSSQTAASLANSVYSGNSVGGCFNIEIITDKFLFKEPVVIEFNTGEISKPVILRVSLADTHPQSVTDVIFVCHAASVSNNNDLLALEQAFKITTNTAELEQAKQSLNSFGA